MRFLAPIIILLITACQPSAQYSLNESPEEHNDRMEWWREARFGLFIHWGLYAVPAGEWGDSKNHAEWIRTTAEIPIDTYKTLTASFNPVKFDADHWVKMAKNAGMKYIVITSKHHDGFCLWDSKYSDFDIMATPFSRDILKELAKACKREDIQLGFYYSIMDWNHPDYLPRRSWEKDRSEQDANFENYVNYMKRQVKELLTEYGDIGIFWFDGEWEATWTEDHGKDMFNYILSLQPEIIINNRVGKGRQGMGGLTSKGKFAGDFGTPEQEIPPQGIPNLDWETCMTMNDHWGYNSQDKHFKSSGELIRKLVDIASKGGNFLLNVGPTASGTFPMESEDILNKMGVWMKMNGESVYGTQASPINAVPWGRCTMKPLKESSRLYLHIFDWPENGLIQVPQISNEVIRTFILSDPDQTELKFTRNQGILIEVPSGCPDPVNTVIVLDIVGQPAIFEK